MKCGEKQFAAYFLQFSAVNVVNRGELLIFTAFSVLLKKKLPYTGSNLLPPVYLQLPYSTALAVNHVSAIS